MKKMLSMLMAIAMVASLAITAFAEDAYPGDSGDPSVLEDATKTVTSTVKGVLQAPSIKVTIPSVNNIFLNPYKMSVKLSDSDTTGSTATIVSVPSVIKSESNVKLDFSVVVTGKPSSGVTLEKASADAKTSNSVYMFVHFKNAASETAAKAITAPSEPKFSGDDLDSVLVQTTASKSTKVLTLAAATTSGSTTTPTYGAYIIGGDIAKAPTSPWTDKHKVDVTIAFSIAPVQASTT